MEGLDGNVTLDKESRETALPWSEQAPPSTLHHHRQAPPCPMCGEHLSHLPHPKSSCHPVQQEKEARPQSAVGQLGEEGKDQISFHPKPQLC